LEKAGDIDFRSENSSKRWSTGYNIAQVDDGEIILDTPPDNAPGAIQAYFFNMRRAPFDDKRVRQAINLLYDFETIKRTILYNQYERINSYFPNSEYGVSGPPTEEELAILEPYKDSLPEKVFTQEFKAPVTDGSGRNRQQLRQALALFNEAGWELSDGQLTKEGQQMSLELLLVQPDGQRVAAPFLQNLNKAGIETSVRIVDSAQYQVRTDDFDFDLISGRLNFFPPPGPELRSYYGMLWEHYVIPQFYVDKHRIAYWNRFGQPETQPKYISYSGSGFPTGWWVDEELDSKLDLSR